MKKNSYQIEKEARYKKIKTLKKFFKAKSINLKNFEKNLNKYFKIHNDFMSWRKNFKYPELDYLKRLDAIKPLPSDKLISDLAESICELKKLFIELKDFKAGAIFKLFLNHVSQCIKVKYKIKYSTKGFFGSSPASQDIYTIKSIIVEYFLDINFDKDEQNAQYRCGCKKTKGYKIYKAYKKLIDSDVPGEYLANHEKYVCKQKKCKTALEKVPIKPWSEDPDSSIGFSSQGSSIDNNNNYKKKLKEFNSLIKSEHNRFLLKKNIFGGSPDKILVLEKLLSLFFETNLFLEDGKIELLLFKQNKITELKKIENRIILNNSKYDINNREEITLYWGETKNNKPHGQGISEKYEIDDINRKAVKSLSPLWWKKYSRDLKAKDFIGYMIIEKYEGDWANGKKNGKGVLTTYTDPAFSSNKDWTPEIHEISKGTFKDDFLFNGKYKEFWKFGKSKIFKEGKEKKYKS